MGRWCCGLAVPTWGATRAAQVWQSLVLALSSPLGHPLALLCLLGVVAAGTGGAGPGEGAGGHPVGMGVLAAWGMQPWGGCSGIPTAGSHTSPFFIFPQRGRPAPRFTQVSVLSRGCWLRVPPQPCVPPAPSPPPPPPVMCLHWACRGRARCGLRGALCHHGAGLHVLRLQAAQPERTVSGGQSRVGGNRCPPPLYPCTLLYGKRALCR